MDFIGALRRHKQVTPSYQPSEGTYKQAATFSQPPKQSKFATCFMKKLENDVKQNSELKVCNLLCGLTYFSLAAKYSHSKCAYFSDR